MDRADAAGLSVATIGHVALFGALSLGLAASIPPKPVPPPAMDVEFVDTVALETAAPVAEAMPQAEAPDVGPPEEAAPQPLPAAEPLPSPPPVELAPPPPAPAPPKVAAEKPKPKPTPKPVEPKPKPPERAKERAREVAEAKVARAKEASAKEASAKAARDKAAREKAATAAAAKDKAAKTAAAGKGTKPAAREPRFGKDLLAGLKDPSTGASQKPAAPAISADAMAAIQSAIKRQVQPCANRQVNPGPGASRISVKLNLRLNKDGSLAAAPRVVGTTGVNDENSRYEKRVSDLAIAAFTGCAPMKGLPVDLYRTAKGGWHNFNMNYKLPG